MLDYRFHYRRNLPHFQPVYSTFFITFRLAGSIPMRVLYQVAEEHRRAMEELNKLSDVSERTEKMYQTQRRAFGKWDNALHDSRSGPHWLEDSRIASMVVETLRFNDGCAYSLHAFCIMPNHAHVILTPLRKEDGAFYSLSGILHSIKMHTAREANRLLNRQGDFWQHENYDHVVRDEQEYWRIIEYTLNNPVKAGLAREWQEWPWSYVAQVS